MLLCIDTAYKYLSLSLIKGDEILYSIDKLCFKNQSEFLFVELEKMFKDTDVDINEISELCISSGPGSYTGIRLTMTLAKVLCSLNTKIKLFTINTLKLYSNGLKDVLVVLDARANRAYIGEYFDDKCIESIVNIENIKLNREKIIGDLSLFGFEDFYFKISDCFLNSRIYFKNVEDVDHLVPDYFKNTDSYLI